jgi:hypothetical protein
MQEDQLIKIDKKISLILKLMASVVIENKSFDDKITFLGQLGFSDNEIAEMSGVKAVTVRARKSNLKKKSK